MYQLSIFNRFIVALTIFVVTASSVSAISFNDLSSYQKQKYWNMMSKECIPLLTSKQYSSYRTCALNVLDKASKLVEANEAWCTDSDNGADYLTKGVVKTDLNPSGIEDYIYTFGDGLKYLFEGACSSNNQYMYYQKNCNELGAKYVADVAAGACVLKEEAEFSISTSPIDGQSKPKVAISNNGNFVVVWDFMEDGDVYAVAGQRYGSDGKAIGNEFKINTTKGPSMQVSIAMDSNENFVVVWNSNVGKDILGQRFSANGGMTGPEFKINDGNGEVSIPNVAMGANGDFVVTWTGLGNYADVFARVFEASGIPKTTPFLVNNYAVGDQGASSVAMDAYNNFVITWSSQNEAIKPGAFYDVLARRYDSSGIPLGDEFLVNSYINNVQWFSDISIDGNGNFFIAWESADNQDGDGKGIFGQRYSANGNPAGKEFQINTYGKGSQGSPKISMNETGESVVIWMGSGQIKYPNGGIYAQKYDSNGIKIETEFLVNSNMDVGQINPAVDVNINGEFVIVWANTQTSGKYGIVGKKYTK